MGERCDRESTVSEPVRRVRIKAGLSGSTAEIIDVHHVAIDQDGTTLVWTGGSGTTPPHTGGGCTSLTGAGVLLGPSLAAAAALGTGASAAFGVSAHDTTHTIRC